MTAFRRGICIMVLAAVVGGAGCPARRAEADTVIVGSRGRLLFNPRAS